MRLVNLTKPDLKPSQRALYEQITGGKRASGPQHFRLVDDTGALVGPFGVMLHEPAIGRPLQELGTALRYEVDMSARLREIAILAVAAATNSEFERYAHERVGRAAGLSDCELRDLANQRFTSDDPVESAAYRFCADLPDAEYDALREVLSEALIIDLVVLVGYYTTLAHLLRVFRVPAPADPEETP